MSCELHGGPYFLYSKPLLLKPMPTFFTFTDNQLASTPVWVRLPNLLWECWCEAVVNGILSMVGTPLATDSLTAKRVRISYARVLVDVDLSQPLCREVLVTLPDGIKISQLIHFEHIPNLCDMCKSFGQY
jgi:hypothetical protein